ncbi:Hypothetical protein SMAX5B_018129 [Scophthalmus maximus]|uniref:Uncharacterized protein n=1 Tax=Scophthalmus maximus TaxID=52904 RepID=A0A2U9CLP8_SCOMX|nr:Hypothetical protein SMAX5B_018129 [Scophthalmus maximus]KAF0031966.1 hypothetical protein F2P81_016521 [Scophthalmus maximus]
MLVKVRFGESQKYVKVAETEEGYDDYDTFVQKVNSGTEVDAEVFEELLRAGNLTIKVSTERSTVVLQQDLSDTSLESHVSDTSSSVPSDSSDATVILKRNSGVKRSHSD